MHRAILEACLPCLLALAASFAALSAVVRLSGARWNWRRLRRLHACEKGGVQSLAFVLTLPIFIVIVLFIVQVSQLMIGTMVVNYAAFAAARSASVWVAANVVGDGDTIDEPANVLPLPFADDNPVLLVSAGSTLAEGANTYVWECYAGGSGAGSAFRSVKYEKVFAAAAMACVPLAPSRDLGNENTLYTGPIVETAKSLYRTMVPGSQSNQRIPKRLENKIAYSFGNTAVRLAYVDKDSLQGPTYKVNFVPGLDGQPIYTPIENEVGWQDPLTVTVTHNFALLPGPGRFLSKFLVRADGRPDLVSPRIAQQTASNNERLYTTPIWASATMTNEGFKSVMPYVQE